MTLWMLVALIALVLVVVVRRFRGTRLVADDLVGAPLVLTAIGLFQLHSGVGLDRIGLGDGAWLAGALVLGLVLGAVRAATVRLSSRDGALLARYTPATLAVWVLSIAGNAGFGMLAAAAGAHPDGRPLQLCIGVGLLGESLVLGMRALSTGLPFSPGTRPGRGTPSRADQIVDAVRAARPVAPPPDGELTRSPSVRDGVAWLRGAHTGAPGGRQ